VVVTTESAMRIHETGGPGVLRYEAIELLAPGAGEVCVRHTAIGVNFVDTYYRTGLYPIQLPAILGNEGVGVVEAIGPAVDGLSIGDRVGYCSGPTGSYATARNYPAERLVKLPDSIGDEDAASLLLQGITAWYLLRRLRSVQAGETIVIHAAAGGVGSLACQWATHIGVRVIGTVGSPAKAAIARENGATEVILYHEEDVARRVRELTDGKGVPVVYDGIGRDTFEISLDCLQPRGLLVSYGNSSGAVTGVSLGTLASKGSLFVTRPILAHYAGRREDLDAGATELFGLVLSGAIRPRIGQRYRLRDASDAHRALEGGQTTGSTVLVP
jgi:NADPH2:quinone reductase